MFALHVNHYMLKFSFARLLWSWSSKPQKKFNADHLTANWCNNRKNSRTGHQIKRRITFETATIGFVIRCLRWGGKIVGMMIWLLFEKVWKVKRVQLMNKEVWFFPITVIIVRLSILEIFQNTIHYNFYEMRKNVGSRLKRWLFMSDCLSLKHSLNFVTIWRK